MAAAGIETEKVEELERRRRCARIGLALASVKVISMNKSFARNSQNFPSIRE
jgi:hypothetical protein